MDITEITSPEKCGFISFIFTYNFAYYNDKIG